MYTINIFINNGTNGKMIAKQNKIYLLASLCTWFAKEINTLLEDLHKTPVHFQEAVGNH